MLHLQKQFAYLPIAFVNVTQIFVKLMFVAMIKNRQQNVLLNQQISFCSVSHVAVSFVLMLVLDSTVLFSTVTDMTKAHIQIAIDV